MLLNHIDLFLKNFASVCDLIDKSQIAAMVQILAGLRATGGRLFILGVGGSAGNASHAVNDFRKICGIEAYSPTDNVSELTARINDDGWDSCFANWLRISRLNASDVVLVLSVGGGNQEKKISLNLVSALILAQKVGSKIVGIVGRDGGYTAKVADACVVIPTTQDHLVTPVAEAFQAVVWHLMVSHPLLAVAPAKWESVATPTFQ